MDFRRVGVCGQNLLKETPGAAAPDHDDDYVDDNVFIGDKAHNDKIDGHDLTS